MTKDEALKLALSALDEVRQETFRLMRNGETLYAEEKVWSTIISIKEVLAQKQEPLAWGVFEGNLHDMFFTEAEAVEMAQLKGNHAEVKPLYTAPQRTWVGLDWLPKHRCGLHLSHNEHRDVYETVEKFYDVDSFISMEELTKAISEDSVWVLRWYPETPIGFHRIAASTLEAIEDKLKEKNHD